jgi:hypothetical protein
VPPSGRAGDGPCRVGPCWPVWPSIASLRESRVHVPRRQLRHGTPPPVDCPVFQRSNGYRAQRSTPTVACKREQCADSSLRVRAAPEGALDSEQCLSGAPRCQSSNGRNRLNPNGWVTWLAHRTMSGAPIDRQPPQRLVWWLGL